MSGSLTLIVIKLIVLAVIARILTPNDFGLVAISIMLVSFALVVCRFGLGAAIVQIPELSQSQIASAISLAVPISALTTGALILAAPELANFFGQTELLPLLYANAAVPFLLGMSQVSEGLLQRDMNFKLLTLIDGISFIFGYGAISISCALLDYGAISVIYGVVAQEVLRTILLFSKRFVWPEIRFSLQESLALVRFGFGLSLVQATNMAAYQLDNVVVGKLLGTQALGLYSRAYQVVTVPTKLVGNSLLKVLFPAMSLVQTDKKRVARAFLRAIGGASFISIPFITYIWIFAPEIIQLILGEQWSQAVIPFQILSLAIFFRVGHKICEATIRAQGTLYRLWFRQLIFAVSVLVFAYVGHGEGIKGVAVGVLLASLLNFAFLIDLTRRLIDLSILTLVCIVLRQILICVPFAILLSILADNLRVVEVGAFLVLSAGAFVFAVTFGMSLWVFPKAFGAEGLHARELAAKYLSGVLAPKSLRTKKAKKGVS